MAKKSNNTWLWVGGIAAVLWLSWRSILRRIRYRIAGLQLVSVTPEAVKLNLMVELYNPSGISAQIGDFFAQVYINGMQVGVVSYPINRYLQPRAINRFTIQVTAQPQFLTAALWQQLISGNLMNMDMDVVGNVQVDRWRVPVRVHLIMEDFIQR